MAGLGAARLIQALGGGAAWTAGNRMVSSLFNSKKRASTYKKRNYSTRKSFGTGAYGPRAAVARTRGFWAGGLSRSKYNLATSYIDSYVNQSLEIYNGAPGILSCLNLIANGTDVNQRDGRRLFVTTYCLRFHFYPFTHTDPPGLQDSQLRLIIFADKQTNGAAPAITDLLVDNSVSSMYNENNRQRFEIFYDKTWAPETYLLPPVGTQNPAVWSATGFKTVRQNLRIRINRTAQYSGTGNSISDIQSNAIWMLWLNDADPGHGYTVDLSDRLYFRSY